MGNLENEIQALGTYDVIEHRWLADIGSDSFVLRHKKSGARIALLPNEDSNKVFYIAFRTPPTDSTGVAHIIEHTVLCGSQNFPVKDPFIEVVKGSLNTFLNAMTYPDKTVYPVASTNEKDFENLMHVYLDAVFHPNIYTEQNIFRQEGWHYEVSDEGEITVNGVVYNEMKGVMSSPEDVLNDQVLASLFPDTTYAIVSGGDPEVIPDLTYEQYLDFHSRYYHPCNSYIYLYGDMDAVERLTFLDNAYLSGYDKIELDSSIAQQEPFREPVTATKSYSIQEGEDPSGKTFLAWNAALPIREDPKKILAFRILDYVLCDAEGAPLKEALRDAGIGADVESLYDPGIQEPYYCVVAKYADANQKDEFLSIIHNTLSGLSENGIPLRSLQAAINYYEFQYREADFGSYPKGLVYGLDICDTWLYDDTKVWISLESGALYEELKEDAKQGYFEALIREYLLENKHESLVILLPEQGLTKKSEQAQKEKMAAFAASLTQEELQKLRDEEAALRIWQETPDSKENVDKIPVLSRSDLGKTAPTPVNVQENDFVIGHPVFTSGIDYVDIAFDATDLPDELMQYLAVYKVLLCALDTEKYSYSELDNEINIVTGGMSAGVTSSSNAHDADQYRILFDLAFKVLDENTGEAVELAKEVLLRTSFADTDRIREVLEEEYASMKADLPASGHMSAVMRASSYLSASGKVVDNLAGIGFYRTLEDLCQNFELRKGELVDALLTLSDVLFCKERLTIDITAEEESIARVLPALEGLVNTLPDKAAELTDTSKVKSKEQKTLSTEWPNEGFTTAGQVQYVCRAGNFLRKGLPYTGSLRVLKVILGYDYLWSKIRVKGGAYGCMSSFGRDGFAYFVSYRDPHLNQTIQAFEEAAEYIRAFDADERTMTKYVIGAISSMDRPMTPSMVGKFSKNCRLMGLTHEDLQKDRDAVLSCSKEDIQKLGDYIDAFIGDDVLCVIGSAGKLLANEELFGSLQAL